MSTSGDPDSCTLPSADAPRGPELEVGTPDITPRAAADDESGHGETALLPAQDGSVAGLLAEALAVLESLRATAFALSVSDAGHRNVKPKKTDLVDLCRYILGSRYRTLNAVMVLLALAVCVGALSFGSHINPVFTISLTSVCTAAVTFGASAAKKRRERRQEPPLGTDHAKHGNDNSE